MFRMFRMFRWRDCKPLLLSGLVLLLSACSTMTSPPLQREEIKPSTTPSVTMAPLQVTTWSTLSGWPSDTLSAAWPAWLQSCRVLGKRAEWSAVCERAQAVSDTSEARLREFFESEFLPYRVVNPEANDSGLITGYYEPLLRGSRTRHGAYRYPLYAVPDDLLIVDMASLYPELSGLRLRGRVVKGDNGVARVVPYFSRAELSTGKLPNEKVLFWVDDAIAAFFLQIQGSGRIALENGEVVRMNYAEQNGHPYRSIGRWLVDQGELSLDKASMQGIKDWLSANPQRLDELLNANPSYVFFREMPTPAKEEKTAPLGPLGALGVPLTPERSLAVDRRYIPLGAPVFLDATQPNSTEPLQRLMLAQDTGGAIRGAVRADFFWGFGDAAGARAGSMRQQGRLWVLLPKTMTP